MGCLGTLITLVTTRAPGCVEAAWGEATDAVGCGGVGLLVYSEPVGMGGDDVHSAGSPP